MTPEIYLRLIKLLPKLSALKDHNRLKTLSEIDRVLAKDGVTWCDIADALQQPPRQQWEADVVLAMIDRIERVAQCVTCGLTANARDFLGQVREDATHGDDVRLTPRQSEWLRQLYERAEAEAKQPATAERLATVDQKAEQQKAPERRLHLVR
jgi:hypothetical protein